MRLPLNLWPKHSDEKTRVPKFVCEEGNNWHQHVVEPDNGEAWRGDNSTWSCRVSPQLLWDRDAYTYAQGVTQKVLWVTMSDIQEREHKHFKWCMNSAILPSALPPRFLNALFWMAGFQREKLPLAEWAERPYLNCMLKNRWREWEARIGRSVKNLIC